MKKATVSICLGAERTREEIAGYTSDTPGLLVAKYGGFWFVLRADSGGKVCPGFRLKAQAAEMARLAAFREWTTADGLTDDQWQEMDAAWRVAKTLNEKEGAA